MCSLGLAFERIGGRKIGVNEWQPCILATGPFQRRDSLVGARLEQLDDAHSPVPRGKPGSVGADAKGVLEIRDRPVRRASQKLAPADVGIGGSPAAIECNRLFVFGNRFPTA